MSSKHEKSRNPTDADLRDDPGIGRSKGADRRDPAIGGETTFEGDVGNDTGLQGRVDPDHLGRRNA